MLLTSWLSSRNVLPYAVLIVCFSFPYGVWVMMWDSILSVPDHCFLITFGWIIWLSFVYHLGCHIRFWMTTYLGKSCSFCLPRVPFVSCRLFMYLVISLLVLRAGYGIWLYQFLIIAYLFTLILLKCGILAPCIIKILILNIIKHFEIASLAFPRRLCL